MAKPHQRVIALVIALLFLFSTIALSAVVVYTIYKDKQTNEIIGEFDDGGGSIASNNSNVSVEGSNQVLQGTKLEGFEPGQPVEQLGYVDAQVGTGEEIKADATITFHYTGALAADGTIFQSSHDSGSPATFPLNQLIPGWQQGIPGMKVGGKRRLFIPWNLGYGEQGSPQGGIPPQADLVFDIEIISAENQ